jgi:hypothetical protein
MKQIIKIIFFALLFCQLATAQTINRSVKVDSKGVMRWTDTQEEVKGFGVNYTLPFAHAYRSAKKLGINPLEAIDNDIYHFSRLGFDLYRVHVWDTEISDTLGNLLFNEHLNAFDYLLKKLAERNINYIITPIAFWGNGWPEPDTYSPGFSAKYGKDNCLTNPAAIAAQERYLTQFMNHVNPYTGIAYKDDPRLIAVEISNEPHHRAAPDAVTNFIKGMVEAIRKTGCEKPIFYNITHSVHLAENYFQAGIQGGTFQWYPTGLGYQQPLTGNFLPNVDKYEIPFEETIKKYKGAKIVYEFDAADVDKSYIYPAMARSFRTAGIQLATHFAYDPTFLAYVNTEYNTHFMNLAYTPKKALSLKICSEIFHEIPMYKDFGSYPKNANFDDFSIVYDKNLAVFNTEKKYFYTNTTTQQPKNPSKLTAIAGTGNSPIVNYDGTGAYFLDKLEEGVWRLEVMPDALIISNPYGQNSLDKTVAVIQWNDRKMSISLADLGQDFELKAVNEGNYFEAKTSKNEFWIRPGVYLITRKSTPTKWNGNVRWNNILIKEFYAPKSSVEKTHIVHQKPNFAIENTPLTLEIEVITQNPKPYVELQITSNYEWKLIEIKHQGGFKYAATVPQELLKKGLLTYYIYVKSGDKVETFPAGKMGFPYDWYFYDKATYDVSVIGKDYPIYLFDAKTDWAELSTRWWSKDSKLVPIKQLNEAEYQIKVNQLFYKDNEDLNGKIIYDYTVKYYVNKKIDPLRKELANKKTLVIKGRSLDEKSKKIQIAVVTKTGATYGKIIDLPTTLGNYEISISELKKVETVTMPRPYPTFLPYYFANEINDILKIEDIEGVQISIGAGLDESELMQPHGVGIVAIWVE